MLIAEQDKHVKTYAHPHHSQALSCAKDSVAHLCREECCAMSGRTSQAPARPLMKGRMLTSSLSAMSSYQDTMGTPLLTW